VKYLILILFLLAGCIDDSIIKPGENTAFLYMRDGDHGWSGGPMLTYDIPQERTCAIGMTVAGRWKTLPYLEAIRASDIERMR